MPQSLYNSPLPRRVDHARQQPLDWRMNNQLQQQQQQQQQQQSLHPDWRLASEKFTNDSNFGNVREEPLRSSFIHQQTPTQLFQPSHEVSILLLVNILQYMLIYASFFFSPLIFFLCFILPLRHRIMFLLHESSNHPTTKRLFFSSRNSRLLTLMREPRS